MAPTDVNEICESNCQDLDSRTAQNVLLTLLCQIRTSVSDANILCSPDDGRPVIAVFVEGGATTFLEIDGTTEYVGTTPTNCTSEGAQIVEYPICDNGTQKLARISYVNGTAVSVAYLLLNRTVSTTPADFALVTYGICNAEESLGKATGNYGQVTVTTDTTPATLVLDANPQRISAMILNQGTTNMFFGFTSAVTTSTGVRLTENMGWETSDYAGPIYAVTASGTTVAGYTEV